MSHLRCPGCGVTVADREGLTKPCPRCMIRTGAVVWMEPRAYSRPELRFQLRGH